MKKSFVLYTDMYEAINCLPDEECGQLFKNIFQYVREEPLSDSEPVAMISFNFIKPHLDRDLKSWEETVKAKSEGGKKAMEKRWGKKKITNDKLVITTNKIVKDSIRSITVNDNVNDNVNVNEKNILAKANSEKTHGNELVNFLFDSFKVIYGYPPTDKRARWDASTLVKRIKKTIVVLGKEPVDENVKRVFTKYMSWIGKQDWGENIQGMGTLMRKYPIYESLITSKEDSHAKQEERLQGTDS